MDGQQVAQLSGSLDLISTIVMRKQPETTGNWPGQLCSNKTLFVNARHALQTDISQHCFNQEPKNNKMEVVFNDGTALMY